MLKPKIDKYKTQVPCFTRTEVCLPGDKNAIKVTIKEKSKKESFSYFHRPFLLDKDVGTKSEFNLFPIVLNLDGSPWSLANLYILHWLEKGAFVGSLTSQAEDLGAFNYWLNQADDPDKLLTHFPAFAIARVTYRFHAHLMSQIYSRSLDPDTASRRMLTVLGFYRWLEAFKFFVPENSICEEKDLTITFKNDIGYRLQKRVISSDLKISTPQTNDPFDGTIKDGGKLRPLSIQEQNWVFESAKILKNTEVYLILLFMVSTGARIQSTGTLRRKHFENPNPKISQSIVDGRDEVRIAAGPGTGIDTKNNKQGLLMVPKEIYDLLHTYASSSRAKYRCKLTKAGIHPDQYLFLTKQGEAYFEAKEYTNFFNPGLERRHFKKGGTVRQFLKDTLIPFIRAKHDKNFNFQLHDLRASYGMNTESILINKVYSKQLNMDKARQILSALMWHKSASTTDLYLNYRSLANSATNALDDYGLQVQGWIESAKRGVNENS